MKTAEITLRSKVIPYQEKINQKLSWRDSWRDPVTGEINEIIYKDEGGGMSFFYDIKSKRQIPYVVDVYKESSRSTYSEIKKFIKKLPFECDIISDIQGTGVTFSVSDKQLGKDFDEVVSSLEQDLSGARFCLYNVVVTEQ